MGVFWANSPVQCLIGLFDRLTPGLSGGFAGHAPGLPGGPAPGPSGSPVCSAPAPKPPGPPPVVPRVGRCWVARARHLGRDSEAVEPRARAG